jgi:hypothetical protein
MPDKFAKVVSPVMKTFRAHRSAFAMPAIILAAALALTLQGCAYTASTAEDAGAPRGPFRSINPTYPAHTWERPWYRVGY